MKPMSISFSRGRRAGITLIEILAGLVVLGVLISTVMVARSRSMRQWADADRKLEAARAVDRMVAGWIGSAEGPDKIPVPSIGTLQGVEGVTWETRWIADPAARTVGAGIVRLEVFQDRRPILTLELLKHLDRRREGGSR